ncbi:MAG TPA: LysR family transcriptional regulator [Burkholderiaceae bacterium]|nr:LysR family transcriptional regulator [Burkholderiaceae bacterium]HQR72370.1 LysR family transcriptional regulator [Burkholderiaceae bacterium]
MATKPLIQRLPRSLKLAELRTFLTVLEQRSFRKAAGALHVTQPAVTKAIAGLEEILGVRLFDRANHGVEPTEYALSLAPRAAAIFDELRRAANELTAGEARRERHAARWDSPDAGHPAAADSDGAADIRPPGRLRDDHRGARDRTAGPPAQTGY